MHPVYQIDQFSCFELKIIYYNERTLSINKLIVSLIVILQKLLDMP